MTRDRTRILLVRHCRTAWNRANRFMGHTDIPLDELGHRQALRLPAPVASWNPSEIRCSPLLRAAQTAQPLSEDLCLPLSEDQRWIEIDMGELAGLTWGEVTERFPDFSRQRRACPAEAVRPGGESDRQLQDRALDAFFDLARDRTGEVTAVVSHGGTIKSVLAGILSVPLAEKWRLAVDNGSLSVLSETQRGWQIDLLNYTDHLRGLHGG